MNEFDQERHGDVDRFHLELIGQMWGKVAGDMYRQYKSRGRGVLALFLMEDFPAGLKDVLPKGAEPTGRGELKEFTGVDDPYEEPLKPEINVKTVGCSPEDCARKIIDHLIEKGFLEG